jgi:hypothetical protein
MLGNTIYSNDFCVDNGNYYEIICLITFLAYLTVDLLACFFLMSEKGTSMATTYIHHAIGIFGSVCALIVGRHILTLSNATCLTELSTPFVSLRALLYMHKKTDSTLYMVNGLLMTVSFFIIRCLFQSWIVIRCLIPAFYRPSMEETLWETQIICYVSTVAYGMLVALNFFWFNKMLQGLLKFFKKDAKPKTQ